MYDAIVRIYSKTENKDVVQNAVFKGWISAMQYKEITSEQLPE